MTALNIQNGPKVYTPSKYNAKCKVVTKISECSGRYTELRM